MMNSRILLMFFVMLSGNAKASLSSDTTVRRDLFFKGTEYTKIFTGQSGTPFLDPDGAVTGWVVYYGVRHENVPLQYDIEDDQLVSRNYTGVFRMQLVRQKVSEFGIDNRVFVRVPEQDIFYERIYHGSHDVLIRWQKVLVRRGIEDGVYKVYKEFYISAGEIPAKVQTSKELFGYFEHHGNKIREYFREQKLSFKKDPEKALIALVQYADINGWHGK